MYFVNKKAPKAPMPKAIRKANATGIHNFLLSALLHRYRKSLVVSRRDVVESLEPSVSVE